MGDISWQSPNVSTIAVENSLQYVGESLSRLMLTQQNINRNMVDHLNLTAEAQDSANTCSQQVGGEYPAEGVR